MTLAPPSTDDLASFAAFAERLCAAARRETLPRFRAAAPVDDKAASREAGSANGRSHFDPVTEADRAAEAAMRALIAEVHPGHGVLGEEHGAVDGDGPYAWTLDPIDGTRGFISGLPLWTTLIALTYEGAPVLGVIDQPYLGERFIGYGGAAWLRSGSLHQPLAARPCPRLTDATVSTTDPGVFNGAEAAAFEQVRRAARLARYGCDAYAYAMLAAGLIDVVIESGLAAYDVHALVPVVEGAGGVFTNWRGERSWDGGQVIAAGDAAAHGEALVALSRAAD